MLDHRFGTVINCIEGRVQQPVADQALSSESVAAEQLKSKVLILVQRHASSVVALVGHHDCLANPATREEQWEQIRRGLQVIRFWNLPVTVIGLWVNEQWQVEVVSG